MRAPNKRYELKRRESVPYRKGDPVRVSWFAYWGGNGTQLRATTTGAAVLEFQERREEIVAYWERHFRGMEAYAARYGTASE